MPTSGTQTYIKNDNTLMLCCYVISFSLFKGLQKRYLDPLSHKVVCLQFTTGMDTGVLSIMPKILEILDGIQMERSVSVSLDRNIRDHFCRWSTYFGWNITDWNSLFHFWQTGSLPWLGNSVKEVKMPTPISISWPDLIGKCCSIFLRYSYWSLTGQFGIMESTQNPQVWCK